MSRALSYLESLIAERWTLGLERVQAVLEVLGHPERCARVIHVAGSNGKGSVAKMSACLLAEAGYKTAFYSSPHLVHLTERFMLLDKEGEREIPLAELEALIDRLRGILETHGLTLSYFEFLTVLAFLWFQKEGAEWMVLETGLGGRLDATNVVKPEIAVVTNITLEHQAYLGDTEEAILKEKQAIIKPGCVALSAVEQESLRAALKNYCDAQSVPLHLVDGRQERLYQDKNRKLFRQLAACLNLSEELQNKALARFSWPGRYQFLAPNLVLDGAHTPAAMRLLVSQLAERQEKIRFLIGIKQDKAFAEMLSLISPLAQEMAFYDDFDGQAQKASVLHKECLQYPCKLSIIRSREELESMLKDSSVFTCVTGSLYWVGYVIHVWTELN